MIFWKEQHKVASLESKVESLEKTTVEQQKEKAAMRAMLKEQAAQIQKVSEHLAASRPANELVIR